MEDKKQLLPSIRKIIHKSIACVGCSVCEVACPTGAMQMHNGQIKVNSDLCTHCLRCHFPNLGCWRFDSLVTPETISKNSAGFNVYKGFGLRTKFLEVYTSTKENFANPDVNTQMNIQKQVASAKCWFRQALLMENKQTTPSKLFSLFELPDGLANQDNWHLIWFGLANYAPLIRLFIISLTLKQTYTDEELWSAMGDRIGEKSKKGALSALKNTFRESPLGCVTDDVKKLTTNNPGAYLVVSTGKSKTTSLTRLSVTPHRLVILYSLYVLAEKAERQSFTIREMLRADMDSAFISPILAFGMDVDEFIKICRGLAITWPEFISCNFTLNLDEITVHTDLKSSSDVIDLIARDHGGEHVV